MDTEDLIVLGAPAETQAAGGETSNAEPQTEGQTAGGEASPAAPGSEQADSATAPKPEAPKADGDEGGEDRPKKRSGIQRMQDRITRLEAENASLRSAPVGAGGDRTAAIEKEIGPAPKESDFDDYAAFEDAKADYRFRKAFAEQRAAEREADASRRQNVAREEAIEAFEDRLDEARAVLPDFDKVLAAARGREVKPHVTELIVESEKGGLLAYHLAQNPDLLTKLNGMTERAAAKAIGALEHRLTPAKPRTATAAPAPAKPVSGAAAPSADPSKMGMEEYAAWRRKNG